MKYQTKTLGTVAEYINGRAFKPSEWENNGLPIIRIQNLTNPNAPFNYSSSEHEKKFLIKNGDLLFAWSASLGAHIWNGSDAWLNQHIFKVIPKNDVDKKFLYYYLSKVVSDLYSKAHGTGMVHITKKPFMNTPIPIPDIMSQRIIVKHIEESLSQLDSAVATLNKTKQQLEIYRQAVLKEAFDTFDQTTTIKDVADTRLGKMLDKEKNTGRKRKYLRNINVRWFDFDLSDLLEMRIEDNEIEKYSIKKGDLVMCEGGEPGRCAVWNKDQTIFYQKALHRIRFFDKSNPYFYMYYFWLISKSGALSNYFTGTGINHLTGQSLSKVLIPICSRELQDKIVNYIESRFMSIDNIETTIYRSLQQAEALRQSIIKQALEGDKNV